MSKVRYSAMFTLPDGSPFVLTRGSRQDYGFTWAWLLLAGADDEYWEAGAVISKGFSRTRHHAESAARQALRDGRIALYAPVAKGGAS
jgi:hypothetical protein